MAHQSTPDVVDFACQTVADLTVLPRLALSDGCRSWVSAAGATHGLWCLDDTSAAVVDNLTVVATSDGVGRWIYFGSGAGAGIMISVPNEAALTAIVATGLPDGQLAWVGDPAGGVGRSQGATWQLVTQTGGGAPAPAISIHMVIASTVAGRVWMRQIELVNQKWIQSITWFIGGAGNDENDGQTNVTALATGAELTRRMAKQVVGNGAPVVITLLANFTGGFDFTGVSGTISIVGIQTTVTTGTLNLSHGINRIGNQFQEIGATANRFAGNIGKKIVLTNGANSGAEAWIDDNHSNGNFMAYTSPFTTQAGGPLSGAVVVITPAGNETFKIVTETSVTQVIVDGESSASVAGILVALTAVSLSAQGDGFRCGTVACNKINISSALTLGGNGFYVLLGCQTVAVSLAGSAGAAIRAGRGIGDFIGYVNGGATFQFSQDQMMKESTVFPNASSVQLDAVGFKNAGAGKLAIDCRVAPFTPASKIAIATALYGTITGANTRAIVTDKYTQIDGGGIVPTMTSAGANVQFGSTTKSWAQLPFVDQFNVGAGAVANSNMAGWL